MVNGHLQTGVAVMYAHTEPLARAIPDTFHPAERARAQISRNVRSFASSIANI